jgi:Helix-turn-helix domain
MDAPSGSVDDEWMSEEETAAEIHKTVRTLRQWRKKRQGPPYAFFGRTVRYHRTTLREYYKANQIQPRRGRGQG